jgi:hypothetical protein
MSTTCAACGAPIPANAAFFVGCGRPLPLPCSACGSALGATDKWCAVCGTSVGAPAPAPTRAPAYVAAPQPFAYPVPVAPAPGKRQPIRLALIAIAAVAVLAAGGLVTGFVKLPGSRSGNTVEQPPMDNLATAAQGTLTLSDAVPVQTIPLDGTAASVTVAAAGKLWNGLKIDLPAGAWPGSTLEITAQTITASTFGPLVTPITPLYTVSGAEGMAPLPVSVKMPATIPADSFAMGFFYDAATGDLEGMPLLTENATSLTVATEHFSSYFGGLVKRALLPATIDSGFRPGKDDWQFLNNGSYVSPNGNCAGQTVSEAWYYLERRLKNDGSPLYGLFDNNGGTKTPTLWEDDSEGYRLANVAQVQFDAGDKSSKTAGWFSSWWDQHADALQYNAFRYAMAVTGEPQLLNLFTPTIGHAMLVYRVAPSGLFVADPNYPGGYRMIPFDSSTSTFGSFLTAANAKDIDEGRGINFTMFIYAAMTAFVDWSTLAADWAAFDAGTIGDDMFPTFSLETQDEKDDWVPLVDGYETTDPDLPVRIVDTQHAGVSDFDVYLGMSDRPDQTGLSQTSIKLEAGSNPLGFKIEGARPNDKVSWIDFVRLTVILGPAASPTVAAGGRWHNNHTVPLKGTDGSSNGEVTDLNMDDGSTPAARWNPPPTDVSAGGGWSSQLETTGNATLAVYIDYYVGATPHHEEWILTSAGTKDLTFTFPAYASNVDFYGVVVKATAGNVSDTWTYYYEWKH